MLLPGRVGTEIRVVSYHEVESTFSKARSTSFCREAAMAIIKHFEKYKVTPRLMSRSCLQEPLIHREAGR